MGYASLMTVFLLPSQDGKRRGPDQYASLLSNYTESRSLQDDMATVFVNILVAFH